MKRLWITVVVLLALLAGASAMAGGTGRQQAMLGGNYGVSPGAAPVFNKQGGDTIYLLGGPGATDGTFETGGGLDWHGWTSLDVTAPTELHWHVSTYNGDGTGANPGVNNHVAYCGDELIPSCGGGDPVGGYGNQWTDYIDWYGAVGNPAQGVNVGMDFYISVNTEPAFDFVFLSVERTDGWDDILTYDDIHLNVHETIQFTVNTADYVNNDEVHLRWEFSSDVAWSDVDCLYSGNGAVQLDDMVITFTQGGGSPVTMMDEDFEGPGLQDLVGDYWAIVPALGVGDYAWLRRNLEDYDPCNFNYSWQASFIDDGLVVDGTGGSQCTTWCYGPDGYTVNVTGGLAGPDFHLENRVITPVLEWPQGNYEGSLLVFDVFHHEERGEYSVWPGMYYQWHVRSTAEADPAAIEEETWTNDLFVYYNSGTYGRQAITTTSYLVTGRTYVQAALTANEYGWVWGWFGTDATPGPYFDNVQFKVFEFTGPAINTREIDIANDSFPERGSVDYSNLQVNWCRFDMARDISTDSIQIDFGDSIVFDISPVRSGSELTTLPRLYYKLKTNAIFNGVRANDLGTPDGDGIISGYVEGDSVRNASGVAVANRWFFDLPDTGVFYPGDNLHYYIWAEDAVGGGAIQRATLPATIVGFDDFSGNGVWEENQFDARFRMTCLPTVKSVAPPVQPRILYWDDSDIRSEAGLNWLMALRNLGYLEGDDFDMYFTNGPSSGVSNGIGGRTLGTAEAIAGYDVLLYSAGNNFASTITPPIADPNEDKGDDTGVLSAWFELGNKKAFFSGDELAYDINTQAPLFLTTFVGVRFAVRSVQSYIFNQTAPLVLPTANNPVFFNADRWIAYGGCPGINRFNGVTTVGTTQRIAEFANPDGQPGGYLYPAVTYRVTGTGNKSIYMNHDFQYINDAPSAKDAAPLSARARVMKDILINFQVLPINPAVDVPNAGVFAASNYPNPFNPNTTIKLALPRASHVDLKVYNVRGELVRTLLNGVLFEAGEHPVVWEGDNDQGGKVASGVYFYQVNDGQKTIVNKMALVK